MNIEPSCADQDIPGESQLQVLPSAHKTSIDPDEQVEASLSIRNIHKVVEIDFYSMLQVRLLFGFYLPNI